MIASLVIVQIVLDRPRERGCSPPLREQIAWFSLSPGVFRFRRLPDREPSSFSLCIKVDTQEGRPLQVV